MQQWIVSAVVRSIAIFVYVRAIASHRRPSAGPRYGDQGDVEAANDILHHHYLPHVVTIIRDTGSKLFRNIGKSLTLSP